MQSMRSSKFVSQQLSNAFIATRVFGGAKHLPHSPLLSSPFAGTRKDSSRDKQARLFSSSRIKMAKEYSSPSFTQLVVDTMRKHFPEELAERSWDNVGLLLGNIQDEPKADRQPVLLLTNDLTMKVAEEAISQRASVIISYHPFIFSGLKSITVNDPQQKTLLLLASHGIAVYCPHTALDAAPNGINTWLGDIVSGSQNTGTVIRPLAQPPAGFEGSGYGRQLDLQEPVSLKELIKRVAGRVGLKQVMVATSLAGDQFEKGLISSVAVCAGSGWDIVRKSLTDAIVTGEMSHHNALSAVQSGKHVITVFHSNSERGYLSEVLQPLLEGELRKVESGARVLVSKADQDPFRIVDVSEL